MLADEPEQEDCELWPAAWNAHDPASWCCDDEYVAEVRRGIEARRRSWTVAAKFGRGECRHPLGHDADDDFTPTGDWTIRSPDAYEPFIRDPETRRGMLDGQGRVAATVAVVVGSEVTEAWAEWRAARQRLALRRAAERAAAAALPAVGRALAHRLAVLIRAAEPRFASALYDVAQGYRALAPPGELLRSTPLAAHAPPSRAYPVTCSGEARLLAAA